MALDHRGVARARGAKSPHGEVLRLRDEEAIDARSGGSVNSSVDTAHGVSAIFCCPNSDMVRIAEAEIA